MTHCGQAATALALLVATAASVATADRAAAQAAPTRVAPAQAPPAPRSVVTRHSGEFGGVKMRYTAWVEDNFVNDSHGRPGASVITVAYTRDGVADPGKRPVIFSFNGGPGAAGSALDFSALGPVQLTGTVLGDPGSGHFADNPDSLLDTADLVFIDPVGTGFSRAFPGENPKQWYSDKGDAASVIAAIEHWLKAHHREASPRYLIGESYGTDRAGRLIERSKELRFSGVVLIALAVPSEGRLIPYVTAIPTMAAGAWYHRKIERGGRTVAQVFDQAEQFARTDYLEALVLGSSLPPAARTRIAQRLSQFIGLPAGLIAADDLRIDKNAYMFNLLADQHLRTGLLDVRVTAPLVANAQGAIDDPALAVLPKKLIGSKHLTAASMGILKNPKIDAYLKSELRFTTQEQYYSIDFIANSQWTYDRGFDPVAAIGTAMKAQPGLRLMWVQGLYDLTCPAYLARYTIDQDGIPSSRLTALLLPGPHAAYTAKGNLPVFATALRRFVEPAERRP